MRALVLCLCAALAFSRVASAAAPPGEQATQGAPHDDVVNLTPEPLPPQRPSLPTLEKGADLSAVLGARIAKVDVILEGERWGQKVLPTPTAVKAGDLLSMTAVRSAIHEIVRTGRFARASASAEATPAGVRLIFRIVARKIIDTLTIDLGGADLDRDELIREADLAEGSELIGADLYEKQERIELLLARRGYPEAKVTITTRSTDDPLRAVLLLEITPNDPRILAERAFYVSGGKGDEHKALTAGYRVKTGDRANEAALDGADEDLTAKLRGRGYFAAKVSHDVVRFRGKVTLRVRVDAGPRTVPRYEGNDSYDDDTLTAALELETENDFNGARLADKLRDFYVKRGFFDAEVTVTERGTAKDPVHHQVFHITEERRVAVTARTYPCLKVDEIKRLRKRTRVLFLTPLLTDDTASTPAAIGREIDSFLEEELPGSDIVTNVDPKAIDALVSQAAGSRATPIDLDPTGTYSPATYERATEHLKQLFRNEGYLHAQVGPVQAIRRRCDPKSAPGTCTPLPLPSAPPDVCTYDASGLPLPVAPLDAALSCQPDPQRGVRCESQLALRMPIKLGPRVRLYDVRIDGARYLTEDKLAQEADIAVGRPVSITELEKARRRVVDAYKEEGFYYADVKLTLDESPDHTRARATLEIQEGEQVIVRDIVIVGADLTSEKVIRRRIALLPGRPYRASDRRKTEERIGTLGVFTSINVALSDPYVPQRSKTVIVTVTEAAPRYVDVGPGFSTGEGVRFFGEYGERNMLRSAIAFTNRLQISYLPDEFIIDPEVRRVWATELNEPSERVGVRETARLDFPEIGLGPLMRMSIEGIAQQQPLRDFRLRKVAGIPSFTYRPFRELLFSISQTVEYNEAKVFAKGTVEDLLATANLSPEIRRALRVPDGGSQAYAQRLVVTWDRRDSSLNPRSGTYFVSGLEHVDWFSLRDDSGASAATRGHFLKFSETFSGYVPLGRRLTLAAQLRLGWNYQLTKNSTTYPDRLFFLGGFESMRAWYSDTFIPQEFIDQILTDARDPNKRAEDKLTASKIPLRGGNLMINPKVELRIPLGGAWETALFTDIGNLWRDASTPFDTGRFPIRVGVGTGIRYQSPIGPAVLDVGFNTTRYVIKRDSPTESFAAIQFAIGVF